MLTIRARGPLAWRLRRPCRELRQFRPDQGFLACREYPSLPEGRQGTCYLIRSCILQFYNWEKWLLILYNYAGGHFRRMKWNLPHPADGPEFAVRLGGTPGGETEFGTPGAAPDSYPFAFSFGFSFGFPSYSAWRRERPWERPSAIMSCQRSSVDVRNALISWSNSCQICCTSLHMLQTKIRHAIKDTPEIDEAINVAVWSFIFWIFCLFLWINFFFWNLYIVFYASLYSINLILLTLLKYE